MAGAGKAPTIRRLFWPVYVVLLLGAALLGTEAVASFLVPSYPARELRPIPADLLQRNLAEAFADRPDLIPVFNDWALRDRPRSFAQPADVKFRSVLVGDSFLEGFFVRAPLSALVEQRWTRAGQTGMEAINFGVSATGPRQYYYRIKEVALALKPDAILLAVYAGNDFISTPYGRFLPPFVAELPIASVLGSAAPRTTWLTVNRLGLSEVGSGNRGIPGEFALLNGYVRLPPAERLDRLVGHMKEHYFPSLGAEKIREVLARGGDRFWAAFDKRTNDPEFLAGWLLSGMIDWETGQWKMPRDAEEADRLEGTRLVEETLTWLVAAERLARENGVPLLIALLPVGTVDPRYVEFWRPWPKYFSASLGADARHRSLAAALRHWSERGSEIVAARVARELPTLRRD